MKYLFWKEEFSSTLSGPFVRIETSIWLFSIIWGFSNVIGKGTPNSDISGGKGAKVPDVKIIQCTPKATICWILKRKTIIKKIFYFNITKRPVANAQATQLLSEGGLEKKCKAFFQMVRTGIV